LDDKHRDNEKGRLIEIEALYVSLCGLSDYFLAELFVQREISVAHLGSGIHFSRARLLAKGPTHLIFFYAIVFAVLWQTKEWRLLIHPAHFAGLAIMLGIFAAWAIPFLHSTTTHVGGSEVVESVHRPAPGIDFMFVSWIQNVPRGSYLFSALVLLFPSSGFSKFHDYAEQRLAARSRLGNRRTVSRSKPSFPAPCLDIACR
jgi:4-amino-4-deoxy-L-arabinose transferase-like glycosyltransferase